MTFQQAADCLARSYDPYARFTSEAIGTALDVLHRACKRPPASVLDLGSGTGLPASLLAQRWPAARFVLLDFSVPMLRQARRRFQAETSPPHEVAADAARLPFPASAFDLVFSSCMVHLVPDQAAMLRETARVTRPGGLVGLVFCERADLATQVVHRLFPRFNDLEAPHHLAQAELGPTLARNGLVLEQSVRIPYEICFEDQEALITFVSSRPYHGFARYSEGEFAAGLEEFARLVRQALPVRDISSPSALTVAVCSRKEGRD